MHKKLAARLLAIPVFALATASAFAVDATSATQLAQSVDMSDAKAAGLIVVGLLIGVGVTLWGARLVMSKFTPKV